MALGRFCGMGKKKKSKRTSVMQSKCKNKNSNIGTNHLADAPPKERREKNVWQTLVEQACKTRQKLSREHKALGHIKDWFVATSFLIEPSRIFDEKRRPRTEVERLLVLVAVLFIGFNLNARWHFPNFISSYFR